MKLQAPTISILGQDPRRQHRINANSFQQNAITTAHGYQYAAFYTAVLPSESASGCYVNISRRQVSPEAVEASPWQNLTFKDYEQVHDDGHNTISIGVCEGDGTVHVAFDHHCAKLKFRISKIGAATDSAGHAWDASLFTETRHALPGLEECDGFEEVTYPRFVNMGDDLVFTHRTGQAGLGSDLLYKYSASTHEYKFLGQHLTGVSNSPYINGIDYHQSKLHISWCYRKFVTAQSHVAKDAHHQQAGPNGPENNYDLNYAFSEDQGVTWKNSHGGVIACMNGGEGVETKIRPGTEGVKVFEIPTGSGILNQESQAADWDGGFWVLNRERADSEETWIVYHRSPEGTLLVSPKVNKALADQEGAWTRMIIDSATRPIETGSRGSICVDRKGDVYLVFPGNLDASLNLMRARKEEKYSEFRPVWMWDGFDGEPCVDVRRLETSDVLSIFTRTSAEVEGNRNVVVLDLLLTEV